MPSTRGEGAGLGEGVCDAAGEGAGVAVGVAVCVASCARAIVANRARISSSLMNRLMFFMDARFVVERLNCY